MSAAPLLRLERISFRHGDDAPPSLVDVDLSVAPGELVLLAGASGSGKSTLLHAACGLAPHHTGGTLGGRVVVAGTDTRDARPGALARSVGTVLQDPETQVVLNGVRSELSLPLELRGAPPATIARAVEEVALALGIERLLDRGVHALSGGELQRVALGAALAAGGTGRDAVRLLLLDEPTSQLDPVAGDELLWLLRRLAEEQGIAAIVAEHRLDRCLHHVDRVVALDAGRVAWDGPPTAFLAWAADRAPDLLPPAARLFALAGRTPLPLGVRAAREALGRDPTGDGDAFRHGRATDESPARDAGRGGGRLRRRRRGERTVGAPVAAAAEGLWLELPDGPAVLRGVDLRIAPGERVALLGRNGAGKSTLLRTLAGLHAPTRGRVVRGGRVGLLTQRPSDHLLHDRVADEADPAALERAGVAHLADRHPGDLSGGERQRVALAVALGGADRPALVALDEPTRGMDGAARRRLGAQLEALAAEGTAILVATHDVEFAAEVADRALLLIDGRLAADGPAGEVLSGGWYFGTQTARVLADRVVGPPPLTPSAGAALLGDVRIANRDVRP
ncbi:ATP-binding cassette domain-containing protein [Patulibacter brassicae]|uniref:ATP-binding cassette domain-containing protein n=1 Tax=Patulibacter brassicae TaxID=1705717 RepID=A0ABU4VG57_9ACTN|nr:ATP-binding cassette domain-containing protein [Patulibacter brassicae]MDX8150807.1 ATP-binding cassette domain-containing protein [Patulibacter brassicae]